MAVLSLRERSALRDAWLAARLDEVVPGLMDRAGIDAWVLAAREYNEDPVLLTMLPATWMSSRRRTIVVFTAGGRRRAAVSRYAVGDAFPGVWDPAAEPDQWAALARYLDEADPARIALGVSSTEAFADGLSAAEHRALLDALPERLRNRLMPADRLAVGWLETRTAAEMAVYREACAIAHDLLRRALSPEAVVPDRTTAADLEWWLRQRTLETGLEVWFHPTVSVQRRGAPPRVDFSSAPADETIRRGDLVHIDFGISYCGLHTDQQQHGYVLGPGEERAPAGLSDALATANRLQDLLLAEFQAGRTGNEILAAARAAAETAGIDGRIYSHPIGYHGHGAGPSIGLWDRQDGVPGSGDLVINPNTTYSIELSATSTVPGWDAPVSIMLEEEAFFAGEHIDWLDGRQTELHLIG